MLSILVSMDRIRHIYRMSGDVKSILQGLIPEIIPSQQCYINTGPLDV
jgi:hypothetical protein